MCPYADGFRVNPGTCSCGVISECTSASGLYCYPAWETCKDKPLKALPDCIPKDSLPTGWRDSGLRKVIDDYLNINIRPTVIQEYGNIEDWVSDVRMVLFICVSILGCSFPDNILIILVFCSIVFAQDMSQVTSLHYLFYRSPSSDCRHNTFPYLDLSKWNVSNIVNLDGTFRDCYAFNGDLSKWDVSKVTTMKQTFQDAMEFNSDISTWNTGKLTTLYWAFYLDYAGRKDKFNSDLSKWDTSHVVDLSQAFYKTTSFNADLSKWNTSRVTNMYYSFREAATFNSDLSKW